MEFIREEVSLIPMPAVIVDPVPDLDRDLLKTLMIRNLNPASKFYKANVKAARDNIDNLSPEEVKADLKTLRGE